MSDLKSQLTRLQNRAARADRQLSSQERPSILFSAKEAANLSPTQVLQMVQGSFGELVNRIPLLQNYHNFLLEGDASLDRGLLPEIENNRMSQEISKVLLLIAPHFLEPSVLKLVELLLRKFSIHRYESQRMVLCFLPFHATAAFSRLLQNVDLNATNSWMRPLEAPILAGKGVDKALIVRTILGNSRGILGEVASLVIEGLRNANFAAQAAPGSDSAGFFSTKKLESSAKGAEPVHFRFYCSLATELMAQSPLPDSSRVPLKASFYSFLRAFAEENRRELEGGLHFLFLLFASHGLFTGKELRQIFGELTKVLPQGDSRAAHQLVRLLWVLCGLRQFKLTRNLLGVILPRLSEAVPEVAKNYSPVQFLNKFTELLGSLWRKKVVPSAEITQLFGAVAQSLNQELPEGDWEARRQMLLNKLAETLAPILSRSSDEVTAWVALLKRLVQALGVVAPIFIRALTDKRSPGSAAQFKANFKRVFGDFMLYGLFEVQGTGSTGASYTDLFSAAPDKKLSILRKLYQDLAAAASQKASSKQVPLQFLEELAQGNIDLPSLLTVERIAGLVSKDLAALRSFRERVIAKLLEDKGRLLEGDSLDLLHPFIAGPHCSGNDLLFCNFFGLLHLGKPVEDILTPPFIQGVAEGDYQFLLSSFSFFFSWAQGTKKSGELLTAVLERAVSEAGDRQPNVVLFATKILRVLRLLWNPSSKKTGSVALPASFLDTFQTLCHFLKRNPATQGELFRALAEFWLAIYPDSRGHPLQPVLENPPVLSALAMSFVESIRPEDELDNFRFLKELAKLAPLKGAVRSLLLVSEGLLVKLISLSLFKPVAWESKALLLGESLAVLLKKLQALAAKGQSGKSPKIDLLVDLTRFVLSQTSVLAQESSRFLLRKLRPIFRKAAETEGDGHSPLDLLCSDWSNLACQVVDSQAGLGFLETLLTIYQDLPAHYSEALLNKIKISNVTPESSGVLMAALATLLLRQKNWDEFGALLANLNANNPDRTNRFFQGVNHEFGQSPLVLRVQSVVQTVLANPLFVSNVKMTLKELVLVYSFLLDLAPSRPALSETAVRELSQKIEVELHKKAASPFDAFLHFVLIRNCWQFLAHASAYSALVASAAALIRVAIGHLYQASRLWKLRSGSVNSEQTREVDELAAETNELKQRLGTTSSIISAAGMNCRATKLYVSADHLLPSFAQLLPTFLARVFPTALASAQESTQGWQWVPLVEAAFDTALLLAEKTPATAIPALQGSFDTALALLRSHAPSDLKLQSVLFLEKSFVEVLSKLDQKKVQNKTLRVIELTDAFLEAHHNTHGRRFLDSLKADGSKKVGKQSLASDASAAELVRVFSDFNQRVFVGGSRFLGALLLAVHLAKKTTGTKQKSVFAVYEQLLSMSSQDILAAEGGVDVLESLSKVLYGAENNVTEVMSEMSLEERQAVHFLRDQPAALRTEVVRLLSSLFAQRLAVVFSDSNHEAVRGFPDSRVTPLLLFLLLNKSGAKRKQAEASETRLTAEIFGELELVVVRATPAPVLLDCLQLAGQRLTGKTIRAPFLSHLLELCLKKLQQPGGRKLNGDTISSFLEHLTSDLLSSVPNLPPQQAEVGKRIVKRAISILEALVEGNPRLVLKAAREKGIVGEQLFDTVAWTGDLQVQLSLFVVVSRLSLLLQEDFLDLLNDLSNRFLEFCQINGPLILQQDGEAAGFAKAFLEFFGNLTTGFGSFLEPFLTRLLQTVAEIRDALPHFQGQLEGLVEQVARAVDFRISFSHIKEGVESAAANGNNGLFDTISLFTVKTIPTIDADTFTERGSAVFGVIQRAIEFALADENSDEHFMSRLATWTEVVVSFSLKCNEAQLTRHFAQLLKTLNKKQSARESTKRKLFLGRLLRRLLEVLGLFGWKVFGEAFAFCTDFLKEANLKGDKGKKTQLDSAHLTDAHREVSRAVRVAAGVKGESLDDFNFEQLSRPIVDHYGALRLGMDKQDLLEYFNEVVSPTLASLLDWAADEYKTKSVVSALSSKTAQADRLTRLLVVQGLRAIVQTLQEAFLAALPEMITRVADLANDVDEEVASVAQSLIREVEQLAGENLRVLLENEDLNFES